MIFAWDEGKSAKIQAERGASFQELEAALNDGGLIGMEESPGYADQVFLIVRLKKEVWCVAAEVQGNSIRLITAYPSRKWRKKYGN